MNSSPAAIKDVWLTHRTRHELGARGASRRYGEGAHSYLAVANYFMEFFARHGLLVRRVDRPELLPRPAAAHSGIHLSINPAEEFRVAKGLPNISYVFWEYDRLLTRETAAGRNIPCDNMTDMRFALSVPDKVWVACSYAQNTLASDGIKSAVVPTPVELPNLRNYADRIAEKAAAATFLRNVPCYAWELLAESTSDLGEIGPIRSSVGSVLEREADRGAKIFFTLFNPLDPRKNFPLLVAGWREFRRSSSVPSTLFVKLSTPHGSADAYQIVKHQLSGMMNDYGVQEDFDAPNIQIIFDPLSQDEMSFMRRATDFYVAVSFCEGQNLPLAEFTLSGALPISPCHTSLADFIAPGGSLIVKSERVQVPRGICLRYGFKDMHWYACEQESYVACLHEASLMSDAVFEERSRAAIASVREYCGDAAVWQRFGQAVSELQR